MLDRATDLDRQNKRQAIEAFSREVKAKLGNNLIDVRLFGSVARGTDTPDSDIDILVRVKESDKFALDAIRDLAFTTNLDYDVLIVPIIRNESQYQNPLFRETAFFHSLENEGMSL